VQNDKFWVGHLNEVVHFGFVITKKEKNGRVGRACMVKTRVLEFFFWNRL